MTIVKIAEVRQYLKVDAMRPVRWAQQGYLPRAKRGVYDQDALNAFLAGCSRNFPAGQPLTWKQLQEGEVVLITWEEATQQFNITENRLKSLRRNGSIAFIKLPGKTGSVRYHLASLSQALIGTLSLVSHDAAKVLGLVTDQVVRQNVSRGKGLERVVNAFDHARVYVSCASVKSMVADQLPGWINPDAWMKACKESPGPLASAEEAAAFLNVELGALHAELLRRRGWFVQSPGKRTVRILPTWLQAQLSNDNRCSAPAIANMFDVGTDEVWLWLRQQLIVCPVTAHNHTVTSLLWELCWGAILEAASSDRSKSTARIFLARLRQSESGKLWTVEEVAKVIGHSAAYVEGLVNQGTLPGVRTPAGEWRLCIDPHDL